MNNYPERPQFHSKGNPRGDFYALAFIKGLYVPPSEKTKDDAFLILNYSPSKAFTRFSFAIDSLDGRLHAYKRGSDTRDAIESALLEAWYEYEAPPHLWSLYPKDLASKAIFANKTKHPRRYWEARSQLCMALAGCRHHAWFKTEECVAQFQLRGPVKPLFRFKDAPRIQNPMEPNAENEEILAAVMNEASAPRC
jgi:hypothetical protein